MSVINYMKNSDILNAFNNHIIELFEDVVNLFPTNTDIKVAKTTILTIRQVNPKLLIKIWKEYIYDKYHTEIESGNINFFIEKDYAEDLKYTNNTASILEKISTLREPIKQMSKENLDKTTKYIQNLSKLCNIYHL